MRFPSPRSQIFRTVEALPGERNTLTVAKVTGGAITVGQTIGGSNFYNQTTSSFAGAINNTQIASFAGTISNGTVGNAGNTLAITSVTGSTPIAVGQYTSGAGVGVGTAITGFVSGTNGGVGTYTVSGNPTSVAVSTAMTGAQPGTTLTVSGVSGTSPGSLAIGQSQRGWATLT